MRRRDLLYANGDPNLMRQNLPFYTKATMGLIPPNKRATYIPVNFSDVMMSDADPGKYYTYGYTPFGAPNFKLTRAGGLIGAIFTGLFGSFKPPTEQNTSITFTTTVTDTVAFRNSVQAMNQAISDFVLKQSQMSVTSISELANFNIVGLNVGSDLNLTINSTQALTYINVGKIDAKSVNQFVFDTATKIFNDILNQFENTTVGSLNLLNKASSNTNLIQSLLNTQSPNDVNVNTVINNSTTVSTNYTYEKQAVYTNLSKNSTINQFAQKFQNSMAQELNINLEAINVTGKADIVLSNSQTIRAVIDIVTKLDVASAAFNTINNSDTFKLDRSVTAESQTVANTSTTTSNTTETVSDVVNSAGNAASNVVGAVGSAAATFGVTMLLPAVLLGGGLLWLLSSGSGGGGDEEEAKSVEGAPQEQDYEPI